jgi:hypothetical protein
MQGGVDYITRFMAMLEPTIQFQKPPAQKKVLAITLAVAPRSFNMRKTSLMTIFLWRLDAMRMPLDTKLKVAH